MANGQLVWWNNGIYVLSGKDQNGRFILRDEYGLVNTVHYNEIFPVD